VQFYLSGLHIEHEHIETLIKGCKKDDRKSQELLYRSYYKATMNICLRYTKSEDDAKLVLNTAFLKVFKKIHQFDSAKASLYTWIRTIIVNCCLDHIKTMKNTLVTNELQEMESSTYVEPEINANIKAEEILGFVRNLPPATRAVFNLYVMEGYSHKEIAGILNISEGTSKWHLSEAKKNLKQQIEDNILS
jgi:RNA polymerase sigma factor (sigma-70 family)